MSVKIPDETLLACLKAVAAHLGYSPRQAQYGAIRSAKTVPEATVRGKTIAERFGGWNNALVAAGLRPIPEFDLLGAIKCLHRATQLSSGVAPNTPEYDRFYRDPSSGVFMSHQMIITLLGSWRHALQVAGIQPSAACRASRTFAAAPGREQEEAEARERMRAELRALREPTLPDEKFLKYFLVAYEMEQVHLELKTIALSDRQRYDKLIARLDELVAEMRKLLASDLMALTRTSEASAA